MHLGSGPGLRIMKLLMPLNIAMKLCRGRDKIQKIQKRRANKLELNGNLAQN